MSARFRAIVLVALVALGLGLLLYPTAANWFAERDQASELTGYARAVESMPGPEQEAMLAAAEAYNRRLSEGRTGSPSEDWADYQGQLAPQPGDVMAELTIPSLKLTLPVYHGTGEDSLQRGVGHLFGSHLPVGGPGTHAVLSGHSGLVDKVLFTHLQDVKRGDLFSINVVGRKLVYKVDQISVVTPADNTLMQPEPGKDYVTLLTCTPTGVNSHRLLVRGERVDPVDKDDEDAVIAGRHVDPGFPWWAVQFAGGVAGSYVLARWLIGPKRGRKSQTATPTAQTRPPTRTSRR
jgi:sortase A